MKAAVIPTLGKLEIWDVPAPQPGPFEALVKIEACGLCGTTDRHIVEGHQCHHKSEWYPAILGHEAVGTVVEIGQNVRKFHVGDRVTQPNAIWPGTVRDGLYSAWGGFAEWGIVREANGEPGAPQSDFHTTRQHVVPPELSVEDAVLTISVAEVASWMEKLGDLREKTLTIGGTGFAACVMSQCAQAKGAKRIIALGRSPQKLEWTKRNGATHALMLDDNTRAAVKDINGGVGVDWFLDAAGHQAVFEVGLGTLRPGGSAAIYGAPDGNAYRVPLGATGSDFSVHYLTTNDDTFYAEACRRMVAGTLKADLLRTHVWQGLEALPLALKEQAGGQVLKGITKITI